MFGFIVDYFCIIILLWITIVYDMYYINTFALPIFIAI